MSQEVRWDTRSLELLQLPERFQYKIHHDIDFLLKESNLNIIQIILFGSCSRKEVKVTSDVDLLVVVEELPSRHVRGDICGTLEEPVDYVHSDIVFYTKEDFATSSGIFTRQIKKEGIILYERGRCL